jgi:hypothetical protein
MPIKKTKSKKGEKKVDKSTKQTVKQSVVVHVHSDKSKSSSKKKSHANVKAFTKGNSYMGGTPMRAVNYPSHNIVINNPQPQPVFMSDIVNRVSALENVRKSQLTDVQQAQSIVQPLATQSPTANKPISEALPTQPIATPLAVPDREPLQIEPPSPALTAPSMNENYEMQTLDEIEKSRRSTIDDLGDIMNMSRGMATDDDEGYNTPMKQITLPITDTPSSALNPLYEKQQNDFDASPAVQNNWGGRRPGAGRVSNFQKLQAQRIADVLNDASAQRAKAFDAIPREEKLKNVFNTLQQNVMRKRMGFKDED